MPQATLTLTPPWWPKTNFDPTSGAGVPIAQPLDPSRADALSIIAMLNSLADQYGRVPDVRFAADSVIGGVTSHNDLSRYFRLLTEWVRQKMVYVPDPIGGEYIISPVISLQRIAANGYAQGDCDDHCILLASLCRSVGVNCLVAGVRLNGSINPNHVINVFSWNGKMLIADTCAKDGMTPPPYNDIVIPQGYL